MEANLKFKGKVLMNLKEYPKLNLKRGFWRWYLVTTDVGQNLFQRAADNIVLYTNVNKITAFYRLFETIRHNRRIVPAKVKRMTYILYLMAKSLFDRPKREFF